jgi:hypothetical protein
MSLRRNKKLVDWFWRGTPGGSVQQLTTPEIFVDNLYTTQIRAFWSEGADSYQVDIATDSGFTSIVDSYTGTATTDTFTGLTADTRYYLRVKALKSGFADSDYGTTDCYTFFSPVAAYLPAGLPYINPGTVANEFASVTNAAIDHFVSVLNTSGPNLSRVGVNLARDHTPVNLPYARAVVSGSTYADFASDIDLGTGAFTILVKGMIFSGTPGGAAQMFSHSTGGERVRWENLSGVYVRINASFSAKMTFPVAPVANVPFDFIIDCDGTNVRASVTGGATWSNTVTRPGSGALFSFSRMAASNSGGNNLAFTFENLLFDSTQIDSTKRDRWWTWMKNADYVSTGEDFTQPLKELSSTFITDPIDGYINAYTGGGNPLKGHGYSLSKNVWSWGEKYALLVQKHFAAPDYADATLFFGDISTNKVHTGIEFGHYYEDGTDNHLVSGMGVSNNQLHVLRFNRHYGANEGSNLFVRKSWKDWNMMGFTTLPRNKEVSKQYLLSDNQYAQSSHLGSLSAIITQRRDPTSALPGRIQCSLSSDGFASFYDMFSIVDTNTANNWMYPHVIYNGTRSECVILFEHVLAGVSPVRCLGITALYTTDFITYRNLANTWSKNVKTSGAVTLTELYTNANIIDARSLTSTMVTHSYITSTGMCYGVVGNGNNNGYLLWYQTIGDALTTKTISFSPDTVVLGTQTDTTGSFQFAYHRSPIIAVYDGGTTFRVIANQVNGGNWLPTVYQTTDNGDTWSKVGAIAGIDNTKQHTEFEISQNIHFNSGQGVFSAACMLSSTTAKPFVKDINNLV